MKNKNTEHAYLIKAAVGIALLFPCSFLIAYFSFLIGLGRTEIDPFLLTPPFFIVLSYASAKLIKEASGKSRLFDLFILYSISASIGLLFGKISSL